MRISIALRRAIERHELSPFMLARKAQLSHSTLSKFLRGQSGIGMDGLDRLCLVMGLRLVQCQPAEPDAEDAEAFEDAGETAPERPKLMGGR